MTELKEQINKMLRQAGHPELPDDWHLHNGREQSLTKYVNVVFIAAKAPATVPP